MCSSTGTRREPINTLIDLTRDKDVAADVVADAYVRVYRAAHTFKGQSAFTTWLYRILTNCFLDMRKKASSRPSVSLETTLQTDDGGMDRQFESDDLSPHDEAERSERERSIQGPSPSCRNTRRP